MTAGEPRGFQRSGRSLLGAAALAVLVPLGGCGIKLQGDAPKCTGPAGYVQWSITDPQGTTLDCDSAGAANMTLFLSDFNQTFPCGTLGGKTKKLPLGGVYTQHGQLLSLTGAVVAETPPVSVTVDGCNLTTLPPLAFMLSGTCNTPSSVQASWVILDAGGNPTDCDTVGAASVVLYLGQQMITFPCGQYAALSDAIAAGSYDTHLALVSSSGASLSVTDTMTIVLPCGAPRDLGTVQFTVN